MTDAEFTYQLIAAGSLIGNALLVWKTLRGGKEKREITPDPLNVRKAERFVTEDEHEALADRVDGHEAELAAIRDRMQGNYNTLMKSEAEGRSRLHHQINALAEDVAAIKAAQEPLKTLPAEFNRAIGRIEGVLQRNQ